MVDVVLMRRPRSKGGDLAPSSTKLTSFPPQENGGFALLVAPSVGGRHPVSTALVVALVIIELFLEVALSQEV